MIAVQVHGNHAAIAFAGSQGNFELNVFKPVLIHNFLHSARLLTDGSRGFVRHCLTGLQVNRAKVNYFVNRSLMLENEGVERIFGVPGEENSDVVVSLRGSKIDLVITRHEQAAAFMAATYGRLTGHPGVCISTLGPGALNFSTGAAYGLLGAMPMNAESYGAKGSQVDSADRLAPVLEAAFNGGGVHLVAAPVDYSENIRVLVEELRRAVPVGGSS